MLDLTGKQTVGSGIAFAVISIIAIILRFLANYVTKKKIGADDFFIVVAVAAYLSHIGVAFWGVYRGGGALNFTSPDFDPTKEVIFLKSLLICSSLFILSVSASKISLLFFYRRIFETPSFRLQSLIIGAFAVAWFIACELTNILSCLPIPLLWDPLLKGHCINYDLFFVYATSFEILIDTAILVLAIRYVLTIQLSAWNKFTVSAIFLLGGFVVITNIIRIHYTYVPHSVEVNLTQTALWDHIQMGSAILCVCLPLYRPLLKDIAARTKSSRLSYASVINFSRPRKATNPSGDKSASSKPTYFPGASTSRYMEMQDPFGSSAHINRADISWTPVKGNENFGRREYPVDSIGVMTTVEIV